MHNNEPPLVSLTISQVSIFRTEKCYDILRFSYWIVSLMGFHTLRWGKWSHSLHYWLILRSQLQICTSYGDLKNGSAPILLIHPTLTPGVNFSSQWVRAIQTRHSTFHILEILSYQSKSWMAISDFRRYRRLQRCSRDFVEYVHCNHPAFSPLSSLNNMINQNECNVFLYFLHHYMLIMLNTPPPFTLICYIHHTILLRNYFRLFSVKNIYIYI